MSKEDEKKVAEMLSEVAPGLDNRIQSYLSGMLADDPEEHVTAGLVRSFLSATGHPSSGAPRRSVKSGRSGCAASVCVFWRLRTSRESFGGFAVVCLYR
eukprot:scaffold754_cov248-Pinguiococcus_pyrenoidosus.AAC.59